MSLRARIDGSKRTFVALMTASVLGLTGCGGNAPSPETKPAQAADSAGTQEPPAAKGNSRSTGRSKTARVKVDTGSRREHQRSQN